MDGCDNCDRFLGIKGDIEKCVECTRFSLLIFLDFKNLFLVPILMG